MEIHRAYKSGFLLVLICLVCSLLISCDLGEKQKLGNVSSMKVLDEYADVEIEIVDGTLTPSGVTVFVKGNEEGDILYGEEFYVEKLVNEKWYEVAPKEDGLEKWYYLIGYDLNTEHTYDWEWYYGVLSKGTYRLILGFSGPGTGENNGFYLDVKFVIN